MRDFLYFVEKLGKAPAGDGDAESWFKFYKWDTSGETFVPKDAPHLPIEVGDFIWFVIMEPGGDDTVASGEVLGGARVTRVENPPLPHQRQEIWYDLAARISLSGQKIYGDLRGLTVVPTSQGDSWRRMSE